MRRNPQKPALSVVSGALATIIEPPASLGEPGGKLWRAIMRQYDIRDAGGLATDALAFLPQEIAPERGEIRATIDSGWQVDRTTV
jgi:hypothetical protein